jgi:hypothetical protein
VLDYCPCKRLQLFWWCNPYPHPDNLRTGVTKVEAWILTISHVIDTSSAVHFHSSSHNSHDHFLWPFPTSLTTTALYRSSTGLFGESACSVLSEGPSFISYAAFTAHHSLTFPVSCLCHGGVSNDKLSEVNMEALEKGVSNLEKQLENLNYFGPPVVVALNEFPGDTQ